MTNTMLPVDDVQFFSFFSEGVPMAGLLRLPDAAVHGPGPYPAVVMATGFGLVKEAWLGPYAEGLRAAGFCTLNFDYRGFGTSGGEPRQRLVPSMQVQDVQNAVTSLQSREDVDGARIGVVGVSLGSAIGLGAAGTDDRIKAFVGLGGPSDLWRTWSALPNFAAFRAKVDAAQQHFVRTGEVRLIAVTKLLSSDPETCAKIERDAPTIPSWRPEITFESLAHLFRFRPEQVAPFVRASCFIFCGDDDLIGRGEAVSAWANAREPKRLVELKGVRHVEIYGEGQGFAPALSAMIDFLRTHLA